MIVRMRKRAEKQLDAIIDYGEKTFGRSIARKLYFDIIHVTDLLATNPLLGKMEPLLEGRRYEYRSLVVHEHYKLIYYVSPRIDILYVAAVWDTRHEPTRLSRKI